MMKKNNPTTVVLIEDDSMVLEIHRQFVERAGPFQVIGTASNGREGMELMRRLKPDLAILDMYMPVQDGLTTLSQLRSEELNIDVIAITAANDLETIRRVLQLGAVDYIMKPFQFERVKQALEQYAAKRGSLTGEISLSQTELDRLLYGQEAVESVVKSEEQDLPKGLQAMTLRQIVLYMEEQTGSRSAEEVAEGTGLARVTARRYLEYLQKQGLLLLDVQYGGVGRPINRYQFKGNPR
ncbi:two-component system response regulator [Chryseobacterium mucoviscidosis]|uniref:response regulator n=1 Tax=unclassified Paenibacillus TaxID=185978 RepID=UPI0009A2B9F6|nr:response regulator [Paenibacillus sp. 11B]MDN8591642.1 response regulator [Paenibacillus sp. 11B]OPG95560.1 two-component system response regulator [Chryseobacterium mucoviscidosis]